MSEVLFVYKRGNQEIPEDVKLVRIDPSVTIIEKWAFEDRRKLQHFQFLEGLQTIGSNAFSNCVSLDSISLPSTMKAIDKAAFYNCISVTSIVLNEGLEIIEPDAFSGCGMEFPWLVRCNASVLVRSADMKTPMSSNSFLRIDYACAIISNFRNHCHNDRYLASFSRTI